MKLDLKTKTVPKKIFPEPKQPAEIEFVKSYNVDSIENNLPAHIKTNDLVEAYDSNSVLLIHKEAIKIPSHSEVSKFWKLVNDDISNGITKNVNSPTFCNRKKIDIGIVCREV